MCTNRMHENKGGTKLEIVYNDFKHLDIAFRSINETHDTIDQILKEFWLAICDEMEKQFNKDSLLRLKK